MRINWIKKKGGRAFKISQKEENLTNNLKTQIKIQNKKIKICKFLKTKFSEGIVFILLVKSLVGNLTVGMIVSGKVENISNRGVWVALGGYKAFMQKEFLNHQHKNLVIGRCYCRTNF